MQHDNDTGIAVTKITIAWVGALFGSLTLSNVALALTIIFTGLQIYKLVREIWFRSDQS